MAKLESYCIRGIAQLPPRNDLVVFDANGISEEVDKETAEAASHCSGINILTMEDGANAPANRGPAPDGMSAEDHVAAFPRLARQEIALPPPSDPGLPPPPPVSPPGENQGGTEPPMPEPIVPEGEGQATDPNASFPLAGANVVATPPVATGNVPASTGKKGAK